MVGATCQRSSESLSSANWTKSMPSTLARGWAPRTFGKTDRGARDSPVHDLGNRPRHDP